MESNGRFYARPFNELHVGEIGKKPLSSERVAIEERLIFVRFQLQQKRPSGKGLHEAFLVRFRDRDICLAEDEAVSLDRFASFSQPWYDTVDKQASIAYQGMAMMSVLSVVSQTHLVAIAPRWLAEEFAESLELQVLPLPLKQNSRTCYLSWHEAAGRDKGHQWMEEQLVSICKR